MFPQEITRVLLNLISNGFYAVSERRGDSCPGFEAELRASTRTRGEHVEIRIRDNGAGIPPEVKEKMFHPWELLPSRSPASTSRHVLFTGRRQSGWQNVRPDSRLRTLPLGCSALPLVAGASSRRVCRRSKVWPLQFSPSCFFTIGSCFLRRNRGGRIRPPPDPSTWPSPPSS